MPLRATSIHGVSIPCLVPLTAGGTRPPIILADASIVIGSGDAAQIRLKSLSVSKAHALLLVEDAKAYVRDLASRTELFVNDVAVREAWLKHGDVVRVGRFGFGVVEDAAVQGRAVGPSEAVMLLRVEGEAEDRRVTEPVVLIGRRAKCDLSIGDDALSGAHAILFRVGGRWHLRDLSSRTGTFVNGAPVRQQRVLAEGDLIRAGRTEMRFIGEERARTPRMAGAEEVMKTAPVEPVSEAATVWAPPVAAPTKPVAPPGDSVEVTNSDVPTVGARQEITTPPAATDRAHEEPPVEAPVGTNASQPAMAEVKVEAAEVTAPPVVSAVELGGEVAGRPGGTAAAPDEGASTSDVHAPTVPDAPAATVARGRADNRVAIESVPKVVTAALPLAAPRQASVAADVPPRLVGEPVRAAMPGRKVEEVQRAPQGRTEVAVDVDDSAVGVEFQHSAALHPGVGATAARGGGRGEGNPSDKEWEQSVTVWSFEDLARRSSGDRAEEEPESSSA